MENYFLDKQKSYWRSLATSVQHPVSLNHWVDSSGNPLDISLFTQIAQYLLIKYIGSLDTGAILEIGCGNGLIISEIQKSLNERWECYGTDISQEMLDRVLNKKIHLICTDAAHIPYAEGTFDLIYMHSILQYFDNDEYVNISIQEAIRVLKKGGFIINNGCSYRLV